MSNYNWANGQFEVEAINDQIAGDLPYDVVEGSLELPPGLPETDAFEAATEAQAATDAAVEVGDYAAAHELRETAEFEADYAGSDAMLHGPDSTDLEAAAEHQEAATELESVQAELAQQGDYAAAQEVAQEAAYEMETADELAGGSDHSGQAELEADNMEWADWHQQQSDDMLTSATEYAEAGDFDAAENHLDSSLDHQDAADNYGDLGEHGGSIADYDYSSEVETNSVDSYSIGTDTSLSDSSSSDFSTSNDFSTDTSTTDDFTV